MSDAAEEGTVVLAQFQEKGRGYRENTWESGKGMNLLASIVFSPDFLQAKDQFMMSKIVSLGLTDYLIKETEQVSIKWPNDIYITNNKVAGILIENTVKGKYLESVIVGIGLNLNQELFLSDAPNPVSLRQLNGRSYHVEEVCSKVTDSIFSWYRVLRNGNSEEINLAYLSRLYRFGEWSEFRIGNEFFEARITGIGEFGQLITEGRSGKGREFMFKEVEMVI